MSVKLMTLVWQGAPLHTHLCIFKDFRTLLCTRRNGSGVRGWYQRKSDLARSEVFRLKSRYSCTCAA